MRPAVPRARGSAHCSTAIMLGVWNWWPIWGTTSATRRIPSGTRCAKPGGITRVALCIRRAAMSGTRPADRAPIKPDRPSMSCKALSQRKAMKAARRSGSSGSTASTRSRCRFILVAGVAAGPRQKAQSQHIRARILVRQTFRVSITSCPLPPCPDCFPRQPSRRASAWRTEAPSGSGREHRAAGSWQRDSTMAATGQSWHGVTQRSGTFCHGALRSDVAECPDRLIPPCPWNRRFSNPTMCSRSRWT
jgi:hypothetical protein